MRFTDSHCHLTMSDAASGLERARSAGVAGFVVPATKLEDAPHAVAVAHQHDDVWAAVGFHPHEAKDCDDAAFAEIEQPVSVIWSPVIQFRTPFPIFD